ncbi:PAS domain S-box protein [Flavilitoribacter nigricans]|nr:PAS domain S-box protein [Flavilitoribacter nigricans]
MESPEDGNIMLELIRNKDWSQTSLGEPEHWPRSLKVGLDIILHSGYPMFIWWGPDLIMFHNDAYLPVLGQKHPDALGQSAREVWAEVWGQIGGVVENVFRGEEFHARDLLMYLGRKGFMEETYWTFSYSPFRDDNGAIGGLFCACNEESAKIQQQRRLSCIKDISSLSARYRELPALGEATIKVLEKNARDIQFSALYLRRDDGLKFDLVAGSKIMGSAETFPAELQPLVGEGDEDCMIDHLQKSRQIVIADDLEQVLEEVRHEDGKPINSVAMVPLLKPGQQEVTGLLLCGLSPYLEMDDEYKNYLTLTAAQISTAIADVRSFEKERKKEIALARSEKRFREMADNVPLIIWVTDKTGRCTYINKQWGIYSGQSESMWKDFGWLEAVHPEDLEEVKTNFQYATETRTPYTQNYRLKDRAGNFYWHVDSGLPNFDENYQFVGFIGAVFNIHEQKVAEEQLKEKEEKLRLAAAATNLGTWDYYPLDGILQWSDICKEIFGIPVREDMTYEKFLDALHEEDRERTDLKVRAALQGTEHYDIEYRVVRRTDGKERWIRATGQSYLNDKNEAYRFIGTAQDITDRKLAEEQKDDFLRIAGHELRTPLTSIAGYLGLLQRMIGEQEKTRPFLDKCLQSTLKMRSLITDFLDISKVERGELSFKMETANFSAIVKDTIDNMDLAATRHVLDLHLEPDLYIYGDEERLEQVVVNLLSNAQKYSPKGQTIKVQLSGSKGRIFFRIQDQGIGMQQKEVEKIFNKFYRAASGSKVKGMGLGLYIVKKIIDYHNGEIRVQTVPGKGTQFTVEFPEIEPS